ncbi:Transcriptional regulator XRE family, partial [Dysosmobacter welbionis]
PARRPVRRIALIAAAAVLVLAVGTAGATGILRSAAEVFSPLFGGAPAQTEIIDKIGYPVGASDTDNGVTVTAD